MGLAEADRETSHKYQGQYLMSHNVQVLVLFVILIALWFFKVCVCKVREGVKKGGGRQKCKKTTKLFYKKY